MGWENLLTNGQIAEETAIIAMHKAIMGSSKQVALIGTGALTNIALLLKVFPGVKSKLK